MQRFVLFCLTFLAMRLLNMSVHAGKPVGAVTEFNAQLQILELLDNVSWEVS